MKIKRRNCGPVEITKDTKRNNAKNYFFFSLGFNIRVCYAINTLCFLLVFAFVHRNKGLKNFSDKTQKRFLRGFNLLRKYKEGRFHWLKKEFHVENFTKLFWQCKYLMKLVFNEKMIKLDKQNRGEQKTKQKTFVDLFHSKMQIKTGNNPLFETTNFHSSQEKNQKLNKLNPSIKKIIEIFYFLSLPIVAYVLIMCRYLYNNCDMIA
ncbi:hypothetical protein RFI_12589 [Reticulomyxa filosa]|uniref:Uncharacterized protein n=1 Tax=Reticulomyxa filosa TaxID=46433 RepID=X6NFP3_RETFI|nr:hypothetical protein RFI_12589 [Reticulomyxa filosa]|eukprot:ETO24569.1 hypothetical protein RFI_12589 [Reticulomyxa filosa]